jgi:dihydropteroate synthase
MNDNTNSMGPRPHDFFWQTTRFNLSLAKPLIMGIVNVTPDSFSDQGQYATTNSAIAHAAQLLKEGADILDVGGESSRPGATPIDAHEEWARVKDVLTEVIGWRVPISLDSYRLETQLRALDLGVDIINDIWALRREGAAQALLSYNCGVCLMHMNGEPSTMQRLPMPLRSDQALDEIKEFLQQRLQALVAMGYSAQRLVIDPGIGFGKTVEQNLHLLKNQASFAKLGSPILIGWSRKSTLGQVCDCDVNDRLIPSIAAMVLAADKGAHILRVHDVRESAQALKICRAVLES